MRGVIAMVALMFGITMLLLATWTAALIERVDALIRLVRDPSMWSLLLVGFMLSLHLVLLYAEGSILVTSTPHHGTMVVGRTP